MNHSFTILRSAIHTQLAVSIAPIENKNPGGTCCLGDIPRAILVFRFAPTTEFKGFFERVKAVTRFERRVNPLIDSQPLQQCAWLRR